MSAAIAQQEEEEGKPIIFANMVKIITQLTEYLGATRQQPGFCHKIVKSSEKKMKNPKQWNERILREFLTAIFITAEAFLFVNANSHISYQFKAERLSCAMFIRRFEIRIGFSDVTRLSLKERKLQNPWLLLVKIRIEVWVYLRLEILGSPIYNCRYKKNLVYAIILIMPQIPQSRK